MLVDWVLLEVVVNRDEGQALLPQRTIVEAMRKFVAKISILQCYYSNQLLCVCLT